MLNKQPLVVKRCVILVHLSSYLELKWNFFQRQTKPESRHLNPPALILNSFGGFRYNPAREQWKQVHSWSLQFPDSPKKVCMSMLILCSLFISSICLHVRTFTLSWMKKLAFKSIAQAIPTDLEDLVIQQTRTKDSDALVVHHWFVTSRKRFRYLLLAV